MLPLDLSYEDLANIKISEKLLWHPEVICHLPVGHANVLKANWARYERYWKSSENRPSSIKTAYCGVSWIVHRAKLALTHPNLETLISVYTGHGYMLEPVEFEKSVDGMIKIHFRRKGSRR